MDLSESTTNGKKKTLRSSDGFGDEMVPCVATEEVASKDELCGVGSWRPACLQKFANHNMFSASFILIGIVQGMIYAYFNGTVTTMEKVFGISSRTMGLLLTGNDISQILCGLAVTHFGGRGSRPRWIATGMILTAASCFIYSSCQLFWNGAVQVVVNSSTAASALSRTHHRGMCDGGGGDSSLWPLWPALDGPNLLESSVGECDVTESNVPSMALFFFAQFISGVGSTALYSLGFTYMDDSVKKRNSPLYIGATISLRSLGPSLGYLLASFSLRIYIDPTKTPKYTSDDPRWLGAWWLGFLVIGTLQLVITFPMLLFPKQLPTNRKEAVSDIKDSPVSFTTKQEHEPKESSFRDFLNSMRRLFTNPVVVFNLASVASVTFSLVGYLTFLPKYFEAQFGQSASQASVFTGLSGTLMIMFGTFVGGIFVWRFKPRALFITSCDAIGTTFFVIVVLLQMNMNCDEHSFVGIDVQDVGLSVTSNCSLSCNCELKYDPVCVMDKHNFLSPCYAGCSTFSQSADGSKTFYNCNCGAIVEVEESSPVALTATSGYCPGTKGVCSYFWLYISLMSLSKLFWSLFRVGNILVFIRCVAKKDKAFAMTLFGLIASIFGFIPGPIMYGVMVDRTCLIWQKTPCGHRGNCWLYDIDSLRFWFHALLAVAGAVSLFFDVLVCIYSRHVNLYDELSVEVVTSFKLKRKNRTIASDKKNIDTTTHV